ncbi:carbohydrate sulfotransferase 10 [Procambarus clarkii]|uniref:carbohydrate sulfotransferase 10 n=1 Tax=Procambarus clarkii TaxID=6728 RepID=UPI0037420A90
MAFYKTLHARVIVLMSLVSAFVYYQAKDVPVLSPSVDVPILSSSVDVPAIESKLLEKKSQSSQSIQQEIIHQESTNASHKEVKSGDAGPSEVAEGSPRSVGVKVVQEQQQWEFPVLEPSGGAFLRTLDFSGYELKDRRFMEARRKLMLRRAEVLRKVCNSRERLARTSVLLRVVWDTTHTPNVVWCPVYKVASTSWMINFLRLAHFNDNNTELANLPAKLKEKKKFKVKYGATQSKVYELYPPPEDPQERTWVFKNSVRALVVRHPYSRLISAYRDKMLKLNPLPEEHHFRDLQLHIIARYRKNKTEISPFPTFPEFVEYVIDSTRGLNTRDEWISKVKCWTPYWAQCNVCASDYNVVLKLESIQKDERFLITLANMTELKKLKSPEWRHLQDGTPSDDLVVKYFKELNLYQIKQLHSRYLLDFLLFGYRQDKQLLKNARE